MTFGATLGFVLSLVLVLGLFALAMRAVRRFAGLGVGAQADLPITVIQRVALGPRQGLAVVQLGERALVVSVGDGGVRPITELDAAERVRLGIGVASVAEAESLPPLRALFARRTASGIARSLGCVLLPFAFATLVLVSGATAVTAQAAAPGTATAGGPQVSPAAQVAQPQANAVLGVAGAAVAQQLGGGNAPRLDLRVGNGDASDLRLSGTVGMVLFLGLLAMLPTLLLLMTSFTRVLIVLHFLRQALGTQNAPPAHLLAALALLLTGFIMAPTLADVNTLALQPWLNGQMDEGQMMQAGILPFREFMLNHTPEESLARFVNMTGQPLPDSPEGVSLPVLMTAFATQELKAAFQMGFAIFLPFVIIDLVVSAVLTSMGMFMLPPTMIALPCKLLLFVLVDGWSLIVGSLISSFA